MVGVALPYSSELQLFSQLPGVPGLLLLSRLPLTVGVCQPSLNILQLLRYIYISISMYVRKNNSSVNDLVGFQNYPKKDKGQKDSATLSVMSDLKIKEFYEAKKGLVYTFEGCCMLTKNILRN